MSKSEMSGSGLEMLEKSENCFCAFQLLQSCNSQECQSRDKKCHVARSDVI